MIAFFIIPDSYPMQVGELELTLNTMFQNMGMNATASWYYDEFVEDGTEYGVRVTASGISQETWFSLLDVIARQACEMYGAVQVQQG